MEYTVHSLRVLEEFGETSKYLPELQKLINEQAAKGYRLHTFETWSIGGNGRGTRVMATVVFERE